MRHTVKHIALLILFAFGTMAVQAQGTIDKLKFEEAEKDFENKRYVDCVNKLEELENKGLKNPTVFYLKIMAKSYLVVGIYRYDKIYQGFQTVDGLRKDCNNYLIKYDIEGLEDKYKDVYNISNQLNHHPKTQQEWDTKVNSLLAAEKQYKEKIIEDFCNNLIKVEKGIFYRGTVDRPHWTKKGVYYSDSEVIENYKWRESMGFMTQKKIELDYNYYVVNQYLTEDILWAILSETKRYYWVNFYPENDIMGLSFLNEKQTESGSINLSKKDGYPINAKESLSLSYENVLYFIQMLNLKTGKKFRLMTEAEWEYAQRGGQKQQLDTIVEKKIIGGNKRKGYQYETTNYYSYKSDAISPCTSTRVKSEDNCYKKPNELGIVIKKYITCGSKMDLNQYKFFSGKASEISTGGADKLIRKDGFVPSDYEHKMTDEFVKNKRGQTFALVLDED